MLIFDMNDLIQEIETNYDINGIRYDEIPLWPYIRTTLFSMYSKKDELLGRINKSRKSILKKLVHAFVVTDFSLLKKKNGVVIFDEDIDVCVWEGRKETKIFEIIREIYADACIPISIPDEQNNISPYSKRIDMNFIHFFLRLERVKLRYDKTKLYGSETLEAILDRMDIHSFDVEDIVKKIVAGKKYYLRLFKKLMPQKVIVSAYYDYARMPAIAAAKELGIDTIEFQHGYIGYDHFAFRAFTETSKEPYADFFFCFGDKFAQTVSTEIIEKDHVIPVGNNYLEKIETQRVKNRVLLRQKYTAIDNKKIIVVVGNNIKYMDLSAIKLALSVVEKMEGFVVIFKPRNGVLYDIHHNDFYIEDDMDVYQCMQAGDITLTNVSTCALESLYLGTPVILDNQDGTAKNRFKTFFENIQSVAYVDNWDDMEKAISTVIEMDRKDVSREGHRFYADHHRERIEAALNHVDMHHKDV